MRKLGSMLLLSANLFVAAAVAQESEILLFPAGAPGETVQLIPQGSSEGAHTGGMPVMRLSDISSPSLTVFPAPEELASGSAMLVCPGGGYNILAYDLEGEEICEWLNNLGITAVLLKYRVPRREGREKHEAPLQDVQRAISYIRANAEALQVDPQSIGVMGFSAGGHLATMASTAFDKRAYPAVDEVDEVSCRPDFCLLVYPAYLDGTGFNLAPEVSVNPQTPPTLLIQAEDDKSYINSSLFYYYHLKEAGIPATMHLYSSGGHGYGLRDTGAPVNEWPDRAEDWFRELQVIE